MHLRDTPIRLLPLLLLSAIFAAGPLRACSVPVFRYALEHWPADPYEAVVFHRGPLTAAQRALARDLGAEGLAGRLHANVSLRSVDLDDHPSPEMLELARQSGSNAFPWLAVSAPPTARSPTTVWSGPLTAEAVAQLLDSPARSEIVERLGQGQSAVWTLLESGDREKDAAAAKLLESRLAELANTLTLPALDPNDIVNGLVSVTQEDLRLEFSVLRLARDAAVEQPFIQTLLATEPDLKDVKEPIVFPVFGRGRALHAFVGAGIKHETIDQAASFLIGKCSCQVKELNPGTDLLLAANWDELIKSHATAAPDLPPLSELARLAPVTVTIGSEAIASTAPGANTHPWHARSRMLYVVGSIGAVLIAAGFLLQRKR